MQIPETLWQYVKEECNRVHHGRVTIEINETANKVDVITEHRERFVKENKPEYKHG